MKLTHKVEYHQDGDGQLVTDLQLREFLAELPDGTPLEPIVTDRGSQRDPWPVLVGLRAEWVEER